MNQSLQAESFQNNMNQFDTIYNIKSLNLQSGDFAYIAPEKRFKLPIEFVAKFIGKQPEWGPLGYVTFKRTYARAIENDNLTEEFWQVLKRNIEGEFSYLKNHVEKNGGKWNEEEMQTLAQESYQRAWDFKWLPPGRGLWMMGAEYVYKNGSVALNNCGYATTEFIKDNFAAPFISLFDYLLLGVGVGFDCRGAGTVAIQKPETTDKIFVVPDTRFGWMRLLENVLFSFVGKEKLYINVDYSQIRKEGEPIKSFGGTSSGSAPLVYLYNAVIKILTNLIDKTITSAAIVDICNLIGKCVVSGNVRRSSEIAFSEITDKEFLQLKDPTESIVISEKMNEIANSIQEWKELEEEKQQWKKIQSNFSPLSDDYITYQATIEMVNKEQNLILNSNKEWVALLTKKQDLPLHSHRWSSNNSVFIYNNTSKENLLEVGEFIKLNGEPAAAFLDNMRNYGRMIDEPNYLDIAASGGNPCMEQILHGFCEEQGFMKGSGGELCNLVENFISRHTSLEDFLKTLEISFLYAKAVTLIPTHNVETNKIISKHRRIGCSITGVADFYFDNGKEICKEWFDTGYKYICEIDKKYSQWLDIPESIKKSSVKPSGTVSLLPSGLKKDSSIEGGMKLSTAPYYFRTIRMNYTSTLLPVLEKAGYRIEDDLVSPRTKVVYFPVKSGSTKFAKETTLLEQIELTDLLQSYWADNMVSCTLTFKPNEADLIPDLLYQYKNKLKSVSFLPLYEHSFAQAPYQECSQEEYETAKRKLVMLDLSTVKAYHDQEDKFCEGEACLVKTV